MKSASSFCPACGLKIYILLRSETPRACLKRLGRRREEPQERLADGSPAARIEQETGKEL